MYAQWWCILLCTRTMYMCTYIPVELRTARMSMFCKSSHFSLSLSPLHLTLSSSLSLSFDSLCTIPWVRCAIYVPRTTAQGLSRRAKKDTAHIKTHRHTRPSTTRDGHKHKLTTKQPPTPHTHTHKRAHVVASHNPHNLSDACMRIVLRHVAEAPSQLEK